MMMPGGSYLVGKDRFERCDEIQNTQRHECASERQFKERQTDIY